MNSKKGDLDQLRIDRNKPVKKSFLGWILAGIAVLAVASVVGGWFFMNSGAAEVRTAIVRESASGQGRTVLNASGYVTPRREATVSSKVTGKITEVLVEEGMAVDEGQVLARLDTSNVDASLGLAEAQLEASKSALEETSVRLVEAQLEFQRTSELAKDKVASQSEFDRAQAEVDSLKARLARQKQDVSVAERQVALWRQEKEDRIIRAPFAGMVVSKDAQPGEMISPVSAGGGFTRTGICTIVDMDSLEVEVDVNENYINRVEPGQAVEAVLDAYPDWKIPSKVIAIIPTADRQKATVKVRVGFDILESRILPQMGVKVAFRAEGNGIQTDSGLIIPKKAVRQQNGRDVVIVVQNGRAERRAVRLGATQDNEVTVLAGLAAGEKVVIEGPTSLAEGDRVTELKP